MISQSCGKSRTHIGSVDLGRQQLSRINLANYVFELEVRTPKKSFAENVSKRKNENTWVARSSIHRCLSHLSWSRSQHSGTSIVCQEIDRAYSRKSQSKFRFNGPWRTTCVQMALGAYSGQMAMIAFTFRSLEYFYTIMASRQRRSGVSRPLPSNC